MKSSSALEALLKVLACVTSICENCVLISKGITWNHLSIVLCEILCLMIVSNTRLSISIYSSSNCLIASLREQEEEWHGCSTLSERGRSGRVDWGRCGCRRGEGAAEVIEVSEGVSFIAVVVSVS